MNTKTLAPALQRGEDPAALQNRLARDLPHIVNAWRKMRFELLKVGLENKLSEVLPDFSQVELRSDPFDKSESLYIGWNNTQGTPCGNMIIHAAGNMFAEYDVLVPHPTDARWFIEAVTAWGGCQRDISTELRLLPAVS